MLLCETAATHSKINTGAWPTLRSAYEEAATLYNVHWSTVRRWVVTYEQNDSAFLKDGRGRHERSWLLSEEDLAMRFDDHFGKLLASEECSVQAMTDFVNKVGDDGLFQEEASADTLKQYGLSFPISSCTVHKWMLRRGGRYGGYSTGFYTDRHEDPDVVEARNRYLDQHSKLMLRRPMFIHLKDDEVCTTAMSLCDCLCWARPVLTHSVPGRNNPCSSEAAAARGRQSGPEAEASI